MIGQILVALVLIAGGVVLWARGADAGRLAEAQRALVTLQYGQAAEAGATTAAAEYWSGNYAAVSRDADPFLAANAAWRAATAAGGDPRTVVSRLDDVAKRYAEVMRDDPANEDAAYNYEFVVRYRAAIAARGAAVPPSAAGEGLARRADLRQVDPRPRAALLLVPSFSPSSFASSGALILTWNPAVRRLQHHPKLPSAAATPATNPRRSRARSRSDQE